MRSPRLAYLAESGFQHAFPISALLRARAAPVFTTGKRIEARFSGDAEVIRTSTKGLSKALRERDIEVVVSTSQRIAPSTLVADHPGLKVVFVGHGESDKVFGQSGTKKGFVHAAVNATFDLVLVASPAHRRAHANPNCERIGHLKHDLFVHGDYATYDFEPRTLLWAPSWGRHNSIPAWLPRVVEASAAIDAQCLLHLHPFSYVAEPAVVQAAQIEMLQNRHFRLVSTWNILDVMKRAAALIGDVSAVCYDWLMFDRPLVFLDHDGLAEEERGLFEAGTVVAPGGVLERALEDALRDRDVHREARRAAFAARFPDADGRAGERALSTIDAYYRRWSQR